MAWGASLIGGIILLFLGIILLIAAVIVFRNSSGSNDNNTLTLSATTNVPTSVWVLGIFGILFFIIGIGLIAYGAIYTDDTSTTDTSGMTPMLPMITTNARVVTTDKGQFYEISNRIPYHMYMKGANFPDHSHDLRLGGILPPTSRPPSLPHGNPVFPDSHHHHIPLDIPENPLFL